MTKEAAIKTAAQWWADRLKERRPHSNGDNSLASLFACLLADLSASREDITDDKLKTFKTELSRGITETLARKEKIGDRYCFIRCDYKPCEELRDAAEKAGISEDCFPFKASLTIEKKDDDNFVLRSRNGYAQPMEEVSAE